MAFGQGIVKKSVISAVELLDTREIMQQLVDITNEGSSFAMWYSWTDRYEPVAQTSWSDKVNVELFSIETITNPAVTVHTANTEITIRVANANGTSFPNVGEILVIPGANKARAMVKAKTADAGGDLLRLKSENGANLNLANGQKLAVNGSAASEGGGPVASRHYLPTTRRNNIQIWDETIYESTDIQMAADVELEINGTKRYLNKQEIEGTLQMMKKISMDLLFAKGTGDNFIITNPTHSDADGAISTTRGVLPHIEAEGINIPGATIGDDLFNNLKRQYDKKRIKGVFDVLGGTELDIQWDEYFYNLGAVPGIAPDNSRWMVSGDKLNLGIKEYTRYGLTFRKMPLLAFNDPNTANFTGSAGYNNYALIIPTAPVALYGGQSAPGIRIRYMPLPMDGNGNVTSNGKYRTTDHGRYANIPTTEKRTVKRLCETKQGLHMLNAPHCTAIELQSSGS